MPKGEKMMLTEKDIKIIHHCLPHIKTAWAAEILGIILGCDHSEVEGKIKDMGFKF